ncbi:p21-activated protein kinase-interacting protein 1-like [Elysia marginata]|uniref:P21-activated protein kinase-interacting protein 1-like n=1 Tax=Elysia marginata TaxID=1093978 RepID=A0AAV4H1K8_9GAST|nr:p21-activated protein kinase-interacting protein 1-like [Elysia marginata]
MDMENIEIVVGTYENHLLGYKITFDHINTKSVLETSFTDDNHRGALRCVAISPTGILASSSTDDSIRMHSLKKRKQIGGIFEHNGTVNKIVFYGNNHMFSASEDGTICLWKTKNWEMMRTLKGHKSHVMAVAVHPSGKLGLSVGSDRSFFTWDLVTGKLAFQRKLQDVAQNILFTPSGKHYVLAFNKKIEVCSLEDTKTVNVVPTDWRINTVCHVEENIFAIGGDGRQVMVVDVLTGSQLFSLDAAKSEEKDFNSRVKCICALDVNDHKYLFLATASGDIKAFLLNLAKGTSVAVLYGQTKVRITTMGVFDSSRNINDVPKPKEKSQDLDMASETKDSESGKPSDSEDESSDENKSVTATSKKRKIDGDISNSKPPLKKKKKSKGSSDSKANEPKWRKDARDSQLLKTKKKLKGKMKKK